MSAIDWAAVPMTQAAQNTKNPGSRVQVVRVPRKAFTRYSSMPWVDIEAAAARGEDGLEPWIVMTVDTPAGAAHLRKAQSDERSLAGMSLLFQQGW